MSITITPAVAMRIGINGTEHEVTVDQALELYLELGRVLGQDQELSESERVAFRYVNSVPPANPAFERIGRVVSIRDGLSGVPNIGIIEEWNDRDGTHDEPRFKWFRGEGIYSIDRESRLLSQ